MRPSRRQGRARRLWLRAGAFVAGGSLFAVGLAVVKAPLASAVTARCLGSPQVSPIASAGSGTNYSLDANGSLWGWGGNYFGEIGNGLRVDADIPLNASGFNSLQAVTAGANSVLVLRQDGTVWGWGDDQDGQLGDGQSGFNVMSVVPKQVPGLSNVVAVNAGTTDNVFAIKSDGTVWAWGRNDYGQLGDGTTTVRAVVTEITALRGVVAVAPSRLFTLALKADGTVWAWGRNSNGQLGANVPLYLTQLTPVQVPGVSNVTAIVAGNNHSVALKSDGTVWSWGYGAMGQLGNGAYSDTPTPQPASGLTGVAAVSASGFYTMALKSNGTAWAWGQNLYGELGNSSAATYQATPVQVMTIGNVAAIAAGGNDAMALTANGAVWDWGANWYGEAGYGSNPNGDDPVRTPFQVSVSQSTPAAPTRLEAVAGENLAYLTWTAPTSAITQYVVTPYLNGVAQTQVAAPVGSTSYTVSGLTAGGNYTFTVAAQNCLGTGAATAQSNRVIPTGIQLDGADAKTESSRLTDRMSLHVNTFNGNLSVSERDVAVRGTGLDLVLDRTYNNKAGTTSIFGRNWAMSGGTNVSLTVLGDGSVMFNDSGSQVGYAKNADGTYSPPSGIDADLVRNGDGTYTLTYRASGESWRFTSAGTATSRADRNNNTIRYTYGGPGGAVSSITDTQGRVTTFAYNAANLVSTITDPAGRPYQYGYDGSNNLTTYTDPANGVTRFAYTSGNLTQITTPAGRVVGIGYNASQQATSITHPLQAGNPTTTFSYNTGSTVVTDANSHTTTYTYDPVGRVTKVTDGLGNQTSASYTANSNVASYSSGNGAASGTFNYDNVNNLRSAAVQPGAHTTLGYTDPNHPHLPTTVTDPQNNTSTLTYDTAGNVVTQTDALPTQNQVRTPRNANGTVASSTDPDGHLTTYGYDARGNLTSVTPPAPLGASTIVYDSLSRVTRVTDGKGQTTTYAYDALDRVTTVTYAGGATVTRVYDADGNVTSLTDATGTTRSVFDAMGRLTSRTTPGPTTVSYAYDGVGNLTSLTDPGGATTYAYSPVNLATRVTDPASHVITLGYDANYNRTSIAYPNGVTVYTTYDAANRLVETHAVKSSQTLTSSAYGYTPGGPTHGSGRAITMVGTPSTFATNGTMASAVTLAAPTGLTTGAVELAQISVAGLASVTSVPPGWTQIRQDATGGTWNDLNQTLYFHVVGSSEPPSYSWGLSRAVEANGGLSAWTGVDTSSPIETSSGQTNAAGTSYPSAVGADRPVGYWRLGELAGAASAVDASESGANGAFAGGLGLGQSGAALGDPNTSAAFNGSNGYIGLQNGLSDFSGGFTFEAWFKPTGTPRWYERLIDIGSGAGSDNILLARSGSSNDLIFQVYRGTTPGPAVFATNALAPDTWQHIAVTLSSSGAATIYRNGVVVGTGTTSAPNVVQRTSNFVGRSNWSGDGYLSGQLDEVAVYRSALDPGQVRDHIAAGGGPSYAATVVADNPFEYWRLGEASGAIAADSSGAANHATYAGGVSLGQRGALSDTLAAGFDGSNGYVALPSGFSNFSGGLTLETWFKPAGTPRSYERLFDFGNGTGSNNILLARSGTTNDLIFQIYNGTTPGPAVYATNALTPNTWQHIAVSVSSSGATTIYRNGVAVATGTATTPGVVQRASNFIGRSNWSNDGYLSGQLDEAAIYDHPLTAARISAHYNAASSSPTAPAWTAPSVGYQNGELDLAFYGGRLFGPAAAIGVPSGYGSAYDTQTDWVSVGMASRTMGAVAGATGNQTVSGPNARWVGQQVLLRPVYDTSLRQTTPDGAVTYDVLNRVTQSGAYSYSYDGASNRLTQVSGTQAVRYATNNANQLTSATKAISMVSGVGGTTGFTATPLAPSYSFCCNTPAAGDQLLLSVTVTQADSVSVPGYTTVATAVSGATPADAMTVLFRRTADGTSADRAVVTPSMGATMVAVMADYRGVDPANPIDTVATGSAQAGATLTNPAVTSSTWGDQLVVFQGAVLSSLPGTWTPPAGLTERMQNRGGALAGPTARSGGMADGALGTQTGSTGSLTSRLATTQDLPANLAGMALTLRPAAPTYGYDGNGNLTGSSDGASLSYDTADRTTSITPAGGSTTTFAYRGSGQAERTTMSPATRVDAACAVISGCRPFTTSLGSTAAFTHTALGVTAETDGTAATYFVRDPSGGLLAERTPTGTYWYLFDGHGSVTGLTDPSGNVAATYGYDPYGQLTSMTGGSTAVNNPWRYVSAYQDGTGLYKMGQRYYDPSTGRFTQQDPVHNPLDPKSWNRYVYVGGDPINFTDPTGLFSFSSLWKKATCFAATAISGFTDFWGAKGGSDPNQTSSIGVGTAVAAVGVGLIKTAASRLVLASGYALAAAGIAVAGYGIYEGIKKCL